MIFVYKLQFYACFVPTSKAHKIILSNILICVARWIEYKIFMANMHLNVFIYKYIAKFSISLHHDTPYYCTNEEIFINFPPHSINFVSFIQSESFMRYSRINIIEFPLIFIITFTQRPLRLHMTFHSNTAIEYAFIFPIHLYYCCWYFRTNLILFD